MFNNFLPRYIAEKGISTGNGSLADTYLQCTSRSVFANFQMFTFPCPAFRGHLLPCIPLISSTLVGKASWQFPLQVRQFAWLYL